MNKTGSLQLDAYWWFINWWIIVIFFNIIEPWEALSIALLELLQHRANEVNWFFFMLDWNNENLPSKILFCIILMKQFFFNNWGLKFGIAISFAYCGPKNLIAQDLLPIIITHYHALFTINHIIKKNFTRKQSNQYYLALFICLINIRSIVILVTCQVIAYFKENVSFSSCMKHKMSAAFSLKLMNQTMAI